MKIEKETRVGDLATKYPLATRVLHRHGIDFCCGGGTSLEEACQKRELDLQMVLNEISETAGEKDGPQQRWDQSPLEDLIDHILVTYHAPLREELPRLEAMARKVNAVHGDRAPDVLPELASVFSDLRNELEQHMLKEEQILFPLIRRGDGFMASGPVQVMEHEHESAGRALQRLRELTNGYIVPDGACNTWRALWHGLAALEESLHQHIHLENNILFPRALKLGAA